MLLMVAMPLAGQADEPPDLILRAVKPISDRPILPKTPISRLAKDRGDALAFKKNPICVSDAYREVT